MKSTVRTILGVDPGTNQLGYAIIECIKQKPKVIAIGTLQMGHLPDHHQKLKRIHERLVSLIDEFKPSEMSVEAPFFGKNVQSMLKLGRAQGVSIAAGMVRGLELAEYSPKKVKLSVTGSGNASKEQVAAMCAQITKKNLDNQLLDATDALAVALCHMYQGKLSAGGKRYNSWSAFVKENPKRTK